MTEDEPKLAAHTRDNLEGGGGVLVRERTLQNDDGWGFERLLGWPFRLYGGPGCAFYSYPQPPVVLLHGQIEDMPVRAKLEALDQRQLADESHALQLQTIDTRRLEK